MKNFGLKILEFCVFPIHQMQLCRPTYMPTEK